MNCSKKIFFDNPEGDLLKIHKKPTSFLGGALMFGFAGICFLILGIPDTRFIFVFLAVLPVFMLGFWDDLKWKHTASSRPYLKFLFLILCSLLSAGFLYYAGIKFYFFPVLAFLYIFALINAVNYQDGMDGQAGVLSLISLLGFSVLGFVLGNNFALTISLIFLGAVLGFMVFNFPPARIFMGDSGAYFLGFALALLAIIFSGNFKNLIAALFVIGLPLLDGVYTNFRRLVSGKSIFFGDREHFYDKLLKKGFPVKKTLLISGALQMVFVAVGVLLYVYF